MRKGRIRTISTVVIARNEGRYLRSTVDQLESTLPAESEIVVVDDGSTDGSAKFLASQRRRRSACSKRLVNGRNLGVARARHAGIRESSGDVVIFADAHINLPPRWWKPLLDVIEDPRIGAAAPAIADMRKSMLKGYGLYLKGAELEAGWLKKQERQPYAVPILPGCCMAIRRDVLEASEGPDAGMISCGGIDNEYCMRLWLLGYELMIVPGVTVEHLFAPRDYPLRWRTILHNRLRLAFIHFERRRIRKVVSALRNSTGFVDGLSLMAGTDVTERRAAWRARRVHDEDWFFDRFGHNW